MANKVTKPPAPLKIMIEYPEDGSHLLLHKGSAAFACFGTYKGDVHALKATLTQYGRNGKLGKATPGKPWPITSEGDEDEMAVPIDDLDWGFEFSFKPSRHVRRLVVEVTGPNNARAVIHVAPTRHKSTLPANGVSRRPRLRVALLAAPPTITFPKTGARNLSRSLLAYGNYPDPPPVSMIAGVCDMTQPGQPGQPGNRVYPPPPGADWAFQFSIPPATQWPSTDQCTLGVSATDAEGTTTTAMSTGLTFA